ncbi:hypothetical protein FDP41_005378 [Naegleria fowleri]|uniref:Uncharacterized protein n=1 Tax=Naegleria fowleri TaxID=5763 RepID=A0A6A5BMU2_NAEFO|nr:uncharacterized protein FDP41_005378 [Naegleria fowleri]KAF0975384.1 hypothetical protein FDP41_005378 [Naegleria fowleri]
MSKRTDRTSSLVRGVLYGLAAGDHNHGPIAMALIIAKQLVHLQQVNSQQESEVATTSSEEVGSSSLLDHHHHEYYSFLNHIFSDYLEWYHQKQHGWDDTGLIGRLIFKSAALVVVHDQSSSSSSSSVNNHSLPNKAIQQNDFTKNDDNKDDITKELYLQKIHQSAKIDQDLNGQTGGVNPAHRNVVLSMFRGWSSIDELLEISHMETIMTHHSRYAVEVAQLQNYICRRWIESSLSSSSSCSLESCSSTTKNSTLSIVTICKDFIEKFSNPKKTNERQDSSSLKENQSDHERQDSSSPLPIQKSSLSKELLTCLKSLIENTDFLRGDALEIARLRLQLSPGGFSPFTMQAALYFVILHTHVCASKYSNDQELVEACLKDSFKFAGNANYCPVLVGPMLGARFGDAVFVNLLSHSKQMTRVFEISHALAQAWQ